MTMGVSYELICGARPASPAARPVEPLPTRVCAAVGGKSYASRLCVAFGFAF